MKDEVEEDGKYQWRRERVGMLGSGRRNERKRRNGKEKGVEEVGT